jgi:hypothetical protein
MHKIVDEPKILGYREINGEQVPVYSCKTETVITNTRTGTTYESEDHCNNDVADPNTDTTDADIKRDVKIFAPRLANLGAVNKKE